MTIITSSFCAVRRRVSSSTAARSASLAVAVVCALVLTPAVGAAQNSQSDVGGVNTTGSGPSAPPAPTEAAVPIDAIITTTTTLGEGSLPGEDGSPLPPETQQGLGDILSGDLQSTNATAVIAELGGAGSLVAQQLARFGQAPSVSTLNDVISAFNALVTDAPDSVLESAAFLTTFEVVKALRASVR